MSAIERRASANPVAERKPQGSPVGTFGERLAAATTADAPAEELRKGCFLLEEGRQGLSVHLVVEGLLKATKSDELGREVVVQLAEPGDLIGLELILGHASSATWEAVVSSKVRPLPAREVRETIGGNAAFALEMSQILMRRLARAENKVRDFAHKSARRRASEVLLLRARCASVSSSEVVVRNLSRQDLAAMAGMTSETFIRILSSFREKGIVKTQGRLITIIDQHRLSNIAGCSARNGHGSAAGDRPSFQNGDRTRAESRNVVV